MVSGMSIPRVLTSVGVFLKGGSIRNALERLPEGTAHLLEHMIINRIPQRIREEYSINGRTTKEYISITGQIPEGSKKSADSLISEINKSISNQQPFSKESLDYEKNRVLKELRAVKRVGLDTIETILSDIYKGTPLEPTILGTPQSIAQITKKDLNSLLKSINKPENKLLVVATGKALENKRPKQNNLNTLLTTANNTANASAKDNIVDNTTTKIDRIDKNDVIVNCKIIDKIDRLDEFIRYSILIDIINHYTLSNKIPIWSTLQAHSTGGVFILYNATATNSQNDNAYKEVIQKAIKWFFSSSKSLKESDRIDMLSLPRSLRLPQSRVNLIGQLFGLDIKYSSEEDILNRIKEVTEEEIERTMTNVLSQPSEHSYIITKSNEE
ncbi:hypothetical protein NEOKW01_0078 [Nematocida sp. AWRm80]|nr:hypothetical protein NEOKW01_0078 [Nematocida sp. AWRm80]